MKKEMNGYTMANNMRNRRREYSLSINAQALFYELIAINNEYQWRKLFKVKNRELCMALEISEKVLIRCRAELMNAGLVFYQCGKSRKIISVYSLVSEFDHCQDYSQKSSSYGSSQNDKKTSTTATSTAVSTAISTAQTTAISPDYIDNKLKVKHKVKHNTVVGEKSPTKKTEFSSVEFWKTIVETWFDFYKQKFSVEPTFSPTMAKSLKSIVLNIKKLGTADGTEWTEDYAKRLTGHFFAKAYNDQWLRDNFLLTNLNSKFDSIVQKTKNNGKQQTGSGVDTGSILAKINSMPD